MPTFAADTHPGRVYDHNEDALALAPERGAFVIADGMGGHASGEVASRIAADAALAAIGNGGLSDALLAAHRAVTRAAAADASRAGMGSTIVAAEIADGHARIAWVGDSRGYLLRRGRLTRLTRDHSQMNLLLDRAEVDAADVSRHPQRHVIMQTLGHGEPQPAEVEARLRAGDRILLCSDGLTDELSDDDIAAILREKLPLRAAVARLIERALAKGGRDNVSIVLIECGRSDAASLYERALLRMREARLGPMWWPAIGGFGAALLAAIAVWILKSWMTK